VQIFNRLNPVKTAKTLVQELSWRLRIGNEVRSSVTFASGVRSIRRRPNKLRPILNYRYFGWFSAVAMLIGFIFLIGSIILKILKVPNSESPMFALNWFALAIMSIWCASLSKQNSDRFERLEAKLKERGSV
jgi:hypothetical protein